MPSDNSRSRANYDGTTQIKHDDDPPHLLGPAFPRFSESDEGLSSDACAAVPSTAHRRKKLMNPSEDEGSYYYFMSEPSLSMSEDGSSQNHEHQPLSPINGGAIHMSTSPSNTSISSLGSPGGARGKSITSIARKRPKQFVDNNKGHTSITSLLGPMEGHSSSSGERDAILDADGKEISRKEFMIPDVGAIRMESNGTGISTISENEIFGSNAGNPLDFKKSDAMDDLSVGSSFSSIHVEDVQDENRQGRSSSTATQNGDGNNNEESFESQNYHTAEESSDEDKVETNNDSDLSYDDATSGDDDEKKETNENSSKKKKKKKEKEPSDGRHFLNRPASLSPDKKSKSRRKSVGEDKDILLQNTDASPMDISPLERIPDWGGSPESTVDSLELVASPSISDDDSKGKKINLITTPPRITSFQYPEEQEDEITPKRKTSQPPSVDNSPLSNSDLGQVLEHLVSPVENPGGDAYFTKVDDEGKKPRKKRTGSSDKRGPGHRRTRSGDGAAATLLTGSSEWIGMELDNLPLPDQRDADEDEMSKESTNDNKDSSQRRRARRRPGDLAAKDKAGNSWASISKISADDVDIRNKNLSAVEEGISTRFSPRIAGEIAGENINEGHGKQSDGHKSLQRSHSFGEYSVSTAESHFSWISNRTSLAQGDRSTSVGELFSGNEGSTQSMTRSSGNYFSDAIKTPPSGNVHHISNTVISDQKKNIASLDTHFRPISHHSSHPILTKPPVVESDKYKDYPTFKCPKCKTVQREFFTVASASKQFEGPTGYLVLYFVLYMMLSLFIFGIEEGWPPMDCIYFSVNTITMTGFGDYVPTADAAKIICAIFVYFGVAVVGLLLGSLHANLLDDTAKKTAKENMINNCPACYRIQSRMNTQSPRRTTARKLQPTSTAMDSLNVQNETAPLLQNKRSGSSADSTFPNNKPPSLQTIKESKVSSKAGKSWFDNARSPGSMLSLGSSPGSDAPAEVMNRQSHTRHYSLDSPGMKNIFDPGYLALNRMRHDSEVTERRTNHYVLSPNRNTPLENDLFVDDPISDIEDEGHHSDNSSLDWSALSHDSEHDIFRPVSKIKAAKYVFLTLKQALANSLSMIVIGSFGFHYIENMSVVDAFYFTTVLLANVGYGDIVPVTQEGKLFCTIYSLVAMGVILHNVSMISMIPLELRKRRIERAVLMQFGDELDDAALKELATGPLVQRLQITENSPEGLGQCTREMFALAMLVRLGRITEQDVRSTFAAFKRLDRDNDGLLTSKEIILSAVERKKREQKLLPRKTENLLPSPSAALMHMQQQQKHHHVTGEITRQDMQMDGERMSHMSNHSNGMSFGHHPLAAKPSTSYMGPIDNGRVSTGPVQRPRGLSFGSAVSAITYDEEGGTTRRSRNDFQQSHYP